MTSLAEVSQMTGIDRATKMVAEAANRMRRLESESELAFSQWVEAQEVAKDEGIPTELDLKPGMAAALSDYKQRLGKQAAREVVDTINDNLEIGWPGENG